MSANGGDKEGPSRKASDCWEIAFGSSRALAIVKAEKQTACTHCGIIVSHHKKSEAVTSHLKKCRVYKNALITKQNEISPSFMQVPVQRILKDDDISRFTVPVMKGPEQEAVHKSLAMFFYNSGTPFQRVEDPYLRRSFELARPGLKLPNRKRLAGDLLDDAYNHVASRVKAQITDVRMSGALCSDGSEDVNGSSITNFNFISGGKNYFIEQTHDGGVTHDAEFVAAEWERVKNTLEPQGYVIVGGTLL